MRGGVCDGVSEGVGVPAEVTKSPRAARLGDVRAAEGERGRAGGQRWAQASSKLSGGSDARRVVSQLRDGTTPAE